VRSEESIDYFALKMTDEEFAWFSKLVVRETGIRLNPAKRELLMNRIRGILRTRGFESYGDYYQWLLRHPFREEVVELIESITTNKTEFFRNDTHVALLRDTILPAYADQFKDGSRSRLAMWSAGCSTGEEPYSLAVLVRELVPHQYHAKVRILASDINTKALATARAGSYDEAGLRQVTSTLRGKYFTPGTTGGTWSVRNVVKDMVEFSEFNLVRSETWPPGPFDVVLCRNVLIYMDEDTKRDLIKKLGQWVDREGYLFLGHSETLHGVDVPLDYVGPSVYRKES
jgi:chemotaxis protein methyltransferase CheR